MLMRTLVCRVGCEDELDGCGGIIYKDADGDIIDDVLNKSRLKWFCDHIKEVKRQYRKFILYRYHSEFNLYEYENYPSMKSGVIRYFNKKYPNSTWDVMWEDV